jgi:hypothetical protein
MNVINTRTRITRFSDKFSKKLLSLGFIRVDKYKCYMLESAESSQVIFRILDSGALIMIALDCDESVSVSDNRYILDVLSQIDTHVKNFRDGNANAFIDVIINYTKNKNRI